MLYVQGMLGLGDNLYQRGVIEVLATKGPLLLETPWPQIYEGIPNLKFTAPSTILRTQLKNIQRSRAWYNGARLPPGHPFLRLSYVPYQRQGIPLYRGLCQAAQIPPDAYFLRLKDPCPNRKGHVMIRPHTLRREWRAPNRGPQPEVIQWALDWCRRQGFSTVVIADIHPPLETYDGPRPQGADHYFEKGELSLEQLLEWTWSARMFIGTVGFAIPMGMALGTPTLILHGGAGGLNGPEMVNAPCVRPLHHLTPDDFCRCVSYEHACPRRINLTRLEKALDELARQT